MTRVHPIRESDLAAVAHRLQAEYPGDGLSLANLRSKIWGDPRYDPACNLGGWQGSRLQAVLLGVVGGERGWIKVMTTRPHAETAEALLQRFQAACRERGATELHVSGSAPSYFLPGVDPTDTATLSFYLQQGFSRIGEAYNMTSNLLQLELETEADEARLAEAGLRCARLRPEDEPALAAFMAEHFSAGWLTETLQSLHNDPVTAHVAWRGEEMAAFAAGEVTNPGWFGPMGTAPNLRGRGLGRVLLLRCLRDLRELGYRQAQIGWVGPLRFYARHCGARVSRLFWQLRKALA